VTLSLQSDRLDFGPVRQGVVLVRDVVVTNAGEGALCITGTHAGCGCLRAAIVGERRLLARESATLRVTLEAMSLTGGLTRSSEPTRLRGVRGCGHHPGDLPCRRAA
jgi:hypothetical protein